MRYPRMLAALLAALITLPTSGPTLADEVKREGSRNCVSTRRLKSTAVIDNKNILFVMIGNTVFHNVLPRQCAGLAREGRFSYGTMAGNVCRHDTIKVVQGDGDMQGGRTCSLGYFYRVKKEDLRALIEGLQEPVPVHSTPPAEVEEIGSDVEDEGDR